MASDRLTYTNITHFDRPVTFRGRKHAAKILQTAKGDFLVKSNHAVKILIDTGDNGVASGHFKNLCCSKRGQSLHHAGKQLEDHIEVLGEPRIA